MSVGDARRKPPAVDEEEIRRRCEENVGALYFAVRSFLAVKPRHQARPLTLDELASLGYEGLRSAAAAWNPARGSFTTLAALCIRRTVWRWFRRQGNGDRCRNRRRRIAAGLKVYREKTAPEFRPLELPDEQAGREPDPASVPAAVESSAVRTSLGRLALRELDRLPEREARIARRYWLDGATLREVGREFSLSRERVRQVVDESCRVAPRPAAVGGAGLRRGGGSVGRGGGRMTAARPVEDEIARRCRDNLGLLFWTAREFLRWRTKDAGTLDLDELASIGFPGLRRAAERWDEALGAFSTYATVCIRSRVAGWFRRHNRRDLERKRARRIAAGLPVKPENRGPQYRPLPERDMIAGRESRPDAALVAAETAAARAALYRAALAEIERLPERERHCARRCWLDDTTHREAGEDLGVGRERVRQLLVQAAGRIRARLRAAGITADSAVPPAASESACPAEPDAAD